MNFHVWLTFFITLQSAGNVYGQYGLEEFKNLLLEKMQVLTENYEKLKEENMELKVWKEILNKHLVLSAVQIQIANANQDNLQEHVVRLEEQINKFNENIRQGF
jgi:hypothetical protein